MGANKLALFDVNNYLTIDALEDGLTIIFPQDLEYGIDGLGWQRLPAGKSSPPIKKGQTISFKAELVPTGLYGIGSFLIDKKCNLLGNVMSILASNELIANCFEGLFEDCITICSVSEGFLPATTLADDCYVRMFHGCTSLVNAPDLPATTLASFCYYEMFHGCTSLVNAPELPAIYLKSRCYEYMFYGCSKVSYIKAMFTTHINATDFTKNWVYGVASTGTFVKNKNATWNMKGVSGVPSGWTIQKV